MLAYLLQHVVEESQSGGDIALSASVQIYLYIYIRFFGGSTHLSHTLAGKEELGNLVSILGGEGTICFQAFLY